MARSSSRARTLSQNFLTDRRAAELLARIAVPRDAPPPLLLEVGAGRGALTGPLARRAPALTAYEIDPRLVPALRARFAGAPHVRVVGGDFLAARPPRTPFAVAGNVPFSRTADVVDWCLTAPALTGATLLTQLEYARRRTGDYGRWTRLTVTTWPCHQWRLMGRVSRYGFRPVPRVDAGLLRLDRRRTPLLEARALPGWRRLVELGFSGVGGTLHASLRREHPRRRVDAALPRRPSGRRRARRRGAAPAVAAAVRGAGTVTANRLHETSRLVYGRRMTSRAHIAMFSIAAHGHVNPSLEVIRELVARGHRVTYAIPPGFAQKAAETGAEPKPWHSTLPGPDADPEAWGATLLDNVEPFLDDAIQALPQLVAAYEGDEPDLVLHDIASYPARVLAHRWGVPAISLSPAMVAWEGYEQEVAEPMWAEPLKTERGQAYYARFGAWLKENGITRHPDPFAGRPDRSLVLIPKALQPNADRVDESVYTFVGACQGDRSAEGQWQRPEGAEKVVLVSLGSAFTKQPAFYRECVRAFGGLPGWHLVLQAGRHVDPAELGEIPDNVEVRSWVPQLAVLKQADLFVTHAGAGGSQEGLVTATPMIAVPQAADQFGNADVLQGLGVARKLLTEEATAEALRTAALALVDDPEVARRLAEIQAQTVREGGTRRAADLIEEELAAARRAA